MRVKYDIPEDKIIDVTSHPNYVTEKESIVKTFKQFFETISEQNTLKQQGVFKDIK